MASPAVIDIESLLQPIDGEFATGSDPRDDSSPLSSYQIIKTARYAARDAEKNNLYNDGASDADEHWRKIINEAPKLLTEKAKDLDVVTWYTEALTRRYGFSGLRDALLLVEGLIERYWDNLYPMPDEDGIETRVAQFAGLNGKSSDGVLIAPIRRIPITGGYTPGPFAFYQYQQAVELERISNEDAKESKAAQLGFSFASIEQVVAATDSQFFVDLLDDIAQMVNSCRNLETSFENHCGRDEAPSMRALINVLQECASAVNHMAKHLLPVAEELVEPELAVDAEGAPQTAAQARAAAKDEAIINRESAFKKLIEIAQFFKKTEPHSPVSYALEKAVKWGNMALDELIVELIPDDTARKHFTMLTGVNDLEN